MSEYERGYAAAREDAARLVEQQANKWASHSYQDHASKLVTEILRERATAIRALQPGSPAQPDPRDALIARMREALRECADDLASEIEARYSHGVKDHPAMAPKYWRDMRPVCRARAVIAEAMPLDPADKDAQ